MATSTLTQLLNYDTFYKVSFNLKVWMVWFKKQKGVVVYRLPFESVEGIVKHRNGTKKGEADVKEKRFG